jgi:Na+/melibiose symporter-like transporter
MDNVPPQQVPAGFRTSDYIYIGVFGLALASMANGLHSIILPLRVVEFAGDAQKSTYLGLLTFAGLIIAMLVQPAAGALSDFSSFKLGRRRPYIVGGTLAVILLLTGIGEADSYAAIFAVWCLIQASANVAQGAYQAFIPDLVPDGKKGRASGVKVLFEVVGGVGVLRLIGYLMGKRADAGSDYWLWISLGVLALIFGITLIITVLGVKE